MYIYIIVINTTQSSIEVLTPTHIHRSLKNKYFKKEGYQETYLNKLRNDEFGKSDK